MSDSNLGPRLRRIRQSADMTQMEAARQLGISPSYLNLIEHGQRPVTVRLLFKIGRVFDVDIQTFSDEDEVQIGNRLRTVLSDPVMKDNDVGESELENVAANMPNVARGFLSLYAAFSSARDRVNLLQEKLSAEAILPATSHEMRTTLTSIRSISEILRDFEQMDPDRRRHFVSILVQESEKLTSFTGRLFDVAGDTEKTDLTQFRSTIDQASEFMARANHHFPSLERNAEDYRDSVGLSEDPEGNVHYLARHITLHFGYEIVRKPEDALGVDYSHLDQSAKTLSLLETLTGPDLSFELAQTLSKLTNERLIDDIFNNGPAANLNGARAIRQQLHQYFANCLLMPYEAFHRAAEDCGYNILTLSQRFAVTLERVAARLTALRRPGQAGVPFHLVTIDNAGSILSRLGESGMPVPLFGGVCPKWSIHSAFERPGDMFGEIITLPDQQLFHTVSTTVERPRTSRNGRPDRIALSIGCSEAYREKLSTLGGWPIGSETEIIEGGVHCRICERTRCRQRAFPTLFEQETGR